MRALEIARGRVERQARIEVLGGLVVGVDVDEGVRGQMEDQDRGPTSASKMAAPISVTSRSRRLLALRTKPPVAAPPEGRVS